MTTLKEIAAEAHVHPTTVSSILNQSKGNSRCSEETRATVLRIAAERGYVRNQLASRLRSRRTNTVCLIAGDIRNPFFASLATAIEEELETHGYQLLLLCRGWKDGQRDQALVRAVFEQPVDGFIAWSETAGKTVGELSEQFPKPIVTVGAPVKGFAGVKLDIGRGLKMAVDDLIQKGHRRLAYYAPEEARLQGMPMPRHKIFEKIVTDKGLPEPQLIFYPGKSWDVAVACDGAETVKLNAGITAVVGFNDVATLGWHKAGRFPKVELVGFDGTDWLRLCEQPVPYVRIPARELARASVAMMLAQLNKAGKAKAKRQVVLPEFVTA